MSRYTDYIARVTADGGVITDTDATLAAFTAIEAAGAFGGLALGISPRFGVKLSGSDITKFYNIADNDLDGTTVGTIARDTSGGWAKAVFAAGATITFPSIVTNVSGMQGCLWKEEASPIALLSNGAVLQWTDGVVTYYAAAAATHVRNPEIIDGPADFGPAAGETSGVWMDTNHCGGVIFIDGVPKKSEFGVRKQTLGGSFAPTIAGVSSNVQLAECLFFNDVTYEQFAVLAADQPTRFVASTPSIYWVRSDTRPTGSQVGAVGSFPAADGTKLAWYSTDDNLWTAAVASFEDMPVTIDTNANITISGTNGRIIEKTGGTPDTYDAQTHTVERAKGGYRVKVKALTASPLMKFSDEFVGEPSMGLGLAIGTNGHVGAGAGPNVVVNDVFDFIVDLDAATVTAKQNGTTVLSGAETGGFNATHDTRLLLWPYGAGAKMEILGFGPHGAAAHIKVAQTSADGSTWGTPTVGHSFLRVSNDAGVTTPSVVVS